MNKRKDSFYINRLQKYWDSNYKEYDKTAEWYVDPAINVWMCEIPELGILMKLICDDNGNIREERETL